MLKPITSEKAVRLIEIENVILFETERENTKEKIKREVEKSLNVKVKKIRTLIHENKKYAYVKLDGKAAADLATKLGMI